MGKTPYFLLGVNLFLIKDKKIRLNKWVILFCAFIAFIACWILESERSLELKRLFYIPLVVAFIYFYDKNKWNKKLFGWAGVFSYENYLMHGYVLKGTSIN